MRPAPPLRALGLMSGTSLDGIDAALLTTDGESVSAFGPFLGAPYEPELRRRLRAVIAGEAGGAAVERDLTDAHAEAVRRLLERGGLGAGEVDVIGFHGHTVLHRPRQRRTRQIGDGARLARITGIDVVDGFRARDVAAGGEGAPLAPLYHAALARSFDKPVAVLNIGGVANLTWIGGDGPEDLLAFDTGPGNAPIDDWCLAHTGRPMDADGRLAAGGRVRTEVVEALLAHDYFERPPPKSLDRGDFTAAAAAGLSPADGAATLTALTAAAAARAGAHLPAPPRRWIVTGGGRRNPVLMAVLRDSLAAPVIPAEAAGWDGDALEAQAFAFLAVRALRGLPLSLPRTTGVPEPLSGGTLHRAREGAERS